MRILAIGAHFDDVEIGCGGSLAKHRADGDDVAIFVATHSGYLGIDGSQMRDPDVARSEGEAAAAILGIDEVHCGGFETNNLVCDEALVVALRRLVDDFKPDLVYSHWLDDVHLDHHNLARAALSACRHVPSFLCYRSNLYASAGSFDGRFLRDISSTLKKKREACLAHASEIDRGLADLVDDILAKNCADARPLGLQAVECFEVIRFLEK
ncbi:MAG: LmbE family N-acetylglucosaminyl deacetylase [Planctomycetota bacterium]|jgi:LmbE family N-acetylglucosaminyl deacetylase